MNLCAGVRLAPELTDPIAGKQMPILQVLKDHALDGCVWQLAVRSPGDPATCRSRAPAHTENRLHPAKSRRVGFYSANHGAFLGRLHPEPATGRHRGRLSRQARCQWWSGHESLLRIGGAGDFHVGLHILVSPERRANPSRLACCGVDVFFTLGCDCRVELERSYFANSAYAIKNTTCQKCLALTSIGVIQCDIIHSAAPACSFPSYVSVP
jgi:hypothetical protein